MTNKIQNVDYFFTDKFINKYKDDYAQMRQIIVDFMTQSYDGRSGDSFYYNALVNEDVKYLNYAKATRRLHNDIKKLKKFVKANVLTNDDLKSFKKYNRKAMFDYLTENISDKWTDIQIFFEDNGEAIVHLGIATVVGVGILGAVHHVGALTVRQGWINDSKQQISENICKDLNWSKFQYNAIGVIKDQNGNYLQVYGVAEKDVNSKPCVVKVNYQIDQELYEKIDESFEIKYSYDEDFEIGKLSNSGIIYSKYEDRLFKQLQTLTDEQTPYSYVEVTKQKNAQPTYNYDDGMER